jgi:uncharacterized protein involved in response to NO
VSLRAPIPIQPVARAASGAATRLLDVDPAWRWRNLLLASHRLGFFLAVTVLVSASAWWALVQVDRASGLAGLSYAVSPSLVHATVMSFGFIPLFFSGFLFTAGPKWLGVRALEAAQLRAPLILQAAGWGLWVLGGHVHVGLAGAGLACAAVGLGWMVALFWRLVAASSVEDRLHAKVIGVGGLVGWLSLAGAGVALLFDAPLVGRACVLSGLWGFVVVTYVTVAHRMIPFFTSSAVPMVAVWRPFWVLWVLLAAAAMEAVAVWVELSGWPSGDAGKAWMLLRGLLELAAGGVVLWLAVAWGLVQSLKIRLLAMLHIGFVWLGLAFVLGGASQLLGLASGVPALAMGALHALSMGCLGSLMLAMVTRVSCGHSGRALVADNLVWGLFWGLQLATLLRIAGAVPGAQGGWILAAALLWAAVTAVWGMRYGSWYGRLRVDGKPG